MLLSPWEYVILVLSLEIYVVYLFMFPMYADDGVFVVRVSLDVSRSLRHREK